MVWLKNRGSGILLHLSALPSCQGIGNLGSSSRRFLNFLSSIGSTYWQICPIGPTGFGNSPYSSLSAFAGNSSLLDFEFLCQHGLLHPDDLNVLNQFPKDKVDHQGLEVVVNSLLRKAFDVFIEENCTSLDDTYTYDTFKSESAYWLNDYALYRAFKIRFDHLPWYEWPKDYRLITDARNQPLSEKDTYYVQFHSFQQYLFLIQWKQLVSDASKLGIQIIGDSPIFVSHDSADVWANPEIFSLDTTGQVVFRAGVPPDYFSEKGQLWGNPVYKWDVLKDSDYKWWMDRLKHDLGRYSVLRLDHFRAFHNYWSIPADAPDACTGTWEPGPGLPFFRKLQEIVPEPRIIAEDLGEMIPEVYALRDAAGFPGMKVLQFAFFGDTSNPHLPHNYSTANCVVFPGTHDNNTSIGWYKEVPEPVRDNYRRYLSVDGSSPSWDLVRAASASVARIALYPLQDLLCLDESARFNTPGVAEGNWSWRVTDAQLDKLEAESSDYLREITRMHGRLPSSEPADTQKQN